MFDLAIADLRDPFSSLPWQVALFRLVVALLLGAMIGWEREIHHKSAGLRTHMLVSGAACLFTLVAYDLIAIDVSNTDVLRVDPLRLVEAITAGVAFLAAGTIINAPDKVRGLTTGAGLWLAGAIGLTCGIGNQSLAIMATIAALVVLVAVRWIARAVGPKTSDWDD